MDRYGGYVTDSEKENGKEKCFKIVKIRESPVSKGSKSFMAPTISAASKIINVHSPPRKNVLAERNDSIPNSSVSFSNENSMHSSVNQSVMITDSDTKTETIEADLFPKFQKIEKANSDETESFKSTVTDIDRIHTNDDLCARFRISPSPSPCYWSCPISAPLESDQLLPPYDPKTNYLSPRPQFLHYRHSPLARTYLSNESFAIEGYSDSDTSEETGSEDSPRESEDALPIEVMEEAEEQQKTVFCELDATDHTKLPENIVESKGQVSKKRFFKRRLKSISLFFILAICLLIVVTDTPMISSPLLKNIAFSMQNKYKVPDLMKESFDGLARKFKHWAANSRPSFAKLISTPVVKGLKLSNPYDVADFVKENIDGFVRKFRFWSANCVSYLTNLIHLPIEVHKARVKFCNMTDEHEDLFIDEHLTIGTKLGKEMFDQNQFGFEIELLQENSYTQDLTEERILDELEVEENQGMGLEENGVQEANQLVKITLETEAIEDKNLDTEVFMQDITPISLQSNPLPEQQFSETNPEVSKIEDQEMNFEENEIEAAQQIDETLEEEAIEESETETETEIVDNSSVEIESIKLDEISDYFDLGATRNNNPLLIGVCLLTICLVSVGFLNAKQAIPKNVISGKNMTNQEIGSEDSEMKLSSFQKKNRRSSNRESMSTSTDFSTDLPSSYGSFTTYEKIQRKNEDEEITTPVRRSSRIRSNQVTTSP